MLILEPLQHFYQSQPFDINSIERLICGDRYTAVLLKNGNIGVAANLQNKVKLTLHDFQIPKLEDIQHRIVLNAYYNALFNYMIPNLPHLDIFSAIKFSDYHQIVMIGFFRPLVSKFNNNQIPLTIFDLYEQDEAITPIEQQNQYLHKADCVILSATSIANNTFINIVNATPDNCNIFILGPSSIIHPDMKLYRNVKYIFGSIFNNNDEIPLDLINKGYSTRDFLKYGKKLMF